MPWSSAQACMTAGSKMMKKVFGREVVSCQIDEFARDNSSEKDIRATSCLVRLLGLTVDAVHKYLVDSLLLESCLLERH